MPAVSGNLLAGQIRAHMLELAINHGFNESKSRNQRDESLPQIVSGDFLAFDNAGQDELRFNRRPNVRVRRLRGCKRSFRVPIMISRIPEGSCLTIIHSEPISKSPCA